MNTILRNAGGATVAIALSVLMGCASTEKSLQERGMKPLGESELRSLNSRERAFRWSSARGTGTGRTWPDGRALAEWSGGSTTGTWRIEGSQFCSKYGTDAERCMRGYRTGDREYGYFLASDGSWYSTVVYTD